MSADPLSPADALAPAPRPDPTVTPPTRRTWAHAVHAALASFSLAYFALALVTDTAYWRTGVLQWQISSTWLLVAGLVMGLLSAVAGLVDWATGGARGRRGFGWPLGVRALALPIAAVNALVHSRDGWVSVVPQGGLLSLGTVVVLLVGGWVGALVGRAQPVRAEVRS